MKAVPLLLFLAVTACAAEVKSTRLFETSLQSRVGYDSNPIGTSGTSAALLGDEPRGSPSPNASSEESGTTGVD